MSDDKTSESNEQPVWKVAAKDSSHPLHEATWTLFREKFNVKRSAARLESQKDQVVDYMMQIIATPELAYDESFGEGYAPINSVKLLGYWQVTQAIPQLIELLEDDLDALNVIWEVILYALANMGEAAIEPMFAYLERNPDDSYTVSAILCKTRHKDERVWTLLCKEFENADPKNHYNVDIHAIHLLEYDIDQAITYLEEQLAKRGRYTGKSRKTLEKYLDEARRGEFKIRNPYDN